MRAVLNRIYDGAGVLAGVFFVLIAVFVIANVFGRQLGIAVKSADEFAGYCMVASSFLGLAATFRDRIHVRVTLLIDRFTASTKRKYDVLCLAMAVGLLAYLTFHVGHMTWESFDFDEKTPGMVPIPLWIPQMGMLLGMFIFLISCVDALCATITQHEDKFFLASEQSNQAE